jgi:hypothetical protein
MAVGHRENTIRSIDGKSADNWCFAAFNGPYKTEALALIWCQYDGTTEAKDGHTVSANWKTITKSMGTAAFPQGTSTTPS